MSTVHICLKDIFDVAVACNVIFYPEDTPFFSGSALAVSGAHSILIDADGTGSVTLLPGRYTVRFAKITGNTDTLIILVPNEEGVYELPDLICSGNWILPFRDFLQKSKNLADVSDPATAFAAIKQPATAEATGAVQLATQAEVDAGSDAAKCVTPATLANLAKWASFDSKLQLVSVANSTARLALTAAQVNVGDLVEQLDTHSIYEVLDTTLLSHEWGYVGVGTRPVAVVVSTLATGLQAEWLFAPGSELLDTSGNGHTLSNTNGVTFDTTDGIAGALFADGSLLECELTPGDEITITLLTKDSVQSGFREAMRLGNDSGMAAYPYHANISAPGWNRDAYDIVGVGSLSTDWMFMSARYADGTWTFSCGDDTGTLEAPVITQAAVHLGAYQNNYSGRVAQVRIWSRALTDAEIATVRTTGATRLAQ